jgi:CCR4-NOT transcription complex subunit 1
MQLNLKFEIEVLCKNLALDINELKPGNLLKDKDRLKNLDEQLSAPKKDVKQPEELPAITTTSKCTSSSDPSQMTPLLISHLATTPHCEPSDYQV